MDGGVGIEGIDGGRGILAELLLGKKAAELEGPAK